MSDNWIIQISVKNARGDMLNVRGWTEDEFDKTWKFAKQYFGLGDFADVPTEKVATNNAQTNSQPKKKDGKMPYIDVENIKLASGGDNPRWVVMGGNFTKYGITCWPEVLEAAGILKKLEATKDNKPSVTWRAYYFEKENDQGKMVPDKVDRLELVK